ncbi:MAG: type II toxin-antitoxin system VapC family toxin [Planctomycetota bacterium]
MINERLLIDTNVLIDVLRGRSEAGVFLENIRGKPAVSAMTVAELYGGVREGEERTHLENLLRGMVHLDIDTEAALDGGLLKRRWQPSHGTGIEDALIAATALQHDLTLVTLNGKHFPMVDKLLIPYGPNAVTP